MAGSINKVILVGNVGKDPEIRTTQDGRKFAKLALATSEQWRDKNSGERKERTEWHNIIVYNDGLAKVVEQYVRKGSKLYIEGQLQTRKWQDQAGADRYTTEIILQNFSHTLQMLDTKGGGAGASAYSGGMNEDPQADYGGGGGSDSGYGGGGSSGPSRSAPAGKANGNGKGFDKKIDDEIPF